MICKRLITLNHSKLHYLVLGASPHSPGECQCMKNQVKVVNDTEARSELCHQSG